MQQLHVLYGLRGESGIRKLSGMVDECILKGSSESLTHALRNAEMEAFGSIRLANFLLDYLYHYSHKVPSNVARPPTIWYWIHI